MKKTLKRKNLPRKKVKTFITFMIFGTYTKHECD